MRHWLTTHYVHQSHSHPYSIYLKDRYKGKERLISLGDRVAFYDLKGRIGGQQGVVALATVSGAIRPNRHREGGPDEGDEIWEWEIPCSGHNFEGFVRRDQLDTNILDRPFTPRIAGGIRKLSPEEFDRLEAAFTRGRHRR